MRKIERFDKYMVFKGLNDNKVTVDLGLSNGTIGKSRKDGRDLSDRVIEQILNFYTDLNRIWLLTGEGEMIKSDVTINPSPESYETYLLPMTAIGGRLSGFAPVGAVLSDCEKIISPIKGVDFAITVYGDSMYPEYPSGSRILIKKIDPSIFIDWGKVYVLDTSNGVIVKEVHHCPDDEKMVICHSINPDPKFSDFRVPLKEVYGMYRVLMCMSAK